MSAEDEDAALAELDQMIADADKVAEIPEEELVPQLPDVPSEKIPGESFSPLSNVFLFRPLKFTREIIALSEAKKEKAKKVGKVALEAS